MLPNRSHVSAFKRTDVDLSIDAGLVVGRNREVGRHTNEQTSEASKAVSCHHTCTFNQLLLAAAVSALHGFKQESDPCAPRQRPRPDSAQSGAVSLHLCVEAAAPSCGLPCAASGRNSIHLHSIGVCDHQCPGL